MKGVRQAMEWKSTEVCFSPLFLAGNLFLQEEDKEVAEPALKKIKPEIRDDTLRPRDLERIHSLSAPPLPSTRTFPNNSSNTFPPFNGNLRYSGEFLPNRQHFCTKIWLCTDGPSNSFMTSPPPGFNFHNSYYNANQSLDYNDQITHTNLPQSSLPPSVLQSQPHFPPQLSSYNSYLDMMMSEPQGNNGLYSDMTSSYGFMTSSQGGGQRFRNSHPHAQESRVFSMTRTPLTVEPPPHSFTSLRDLSVTSESQQSLSQRPPQHQQPHLRSFSEFSSRLHWYKSI